MPNHSQWLAKLKSIKLNFGSVTFSIDAYNSPNFDGWLGKAKVIKGLGLWSAHRNLFVKLQKNAEYFVSSWIKEWAGQSVS